MTNDEINVHLANKTADLLAEWAGLPMAAKISDGRDASAGSAICLMVLSGSVQNADVTPDSRDKLAAMVLASLNRGEYVSYSTDYGPSRVLAELGSACGIDPRAWPSKSMMHVGRVCSDGSGTNSVSVSTGYHGRRTTYHLIDDGWIVASVSVPRELYSLVRSACERGELPATVAQWVPFVKQE